MTKHYKVTLAFLPLFLSAFLSASAANTAPKVVFIGDWITYGWPLPNNWINKGVPQSGQCCDQPGTSSDVLARFQSDVVSLHPAVVHIMIGAADATVVYDSGFQLYIPDFFLNLDAMVKEARASNIKVILGMGAQNFEFAGNVEPINAVIAAYGAANNIPVINYGDVLCNCIGIINPGGVGATNAIWGDPYVPANPYMVPDAPGDTTLVPSAAGYAVMTQMVENAITSMTYPLKSGYLQNVQEGNANEGTDGPTPNVNTVAPNAVIHFTPQGVFSNGSTYPMLNSTFNGVNGTWTSSNPEVMYVGPKGLAWALSPGKSNITYTSPSGVRFSYWTMTVQQPFP